jgi:hypothetical protein
VSREIARRSTGRRQHLAVSALGAAVAAALALLSLGQADALTVSDVSATAAALASAAVPSAPAALPDHGGAVLASAELRTIWWGPTAAFPADERRTVEAELAALDGSSYLGVVGQYLRGATAHLTYRASSSWTDTSASPSGTVTADAVAAEVAAYLTATGQRPSSHVVYVVLSATMAGDLCAFHTSRAVTANGSTAVVPVVFLPDTTGVAVCDTHLARAGLSEGTRSVISSAAHELVETMTDPIPGATWSAGSGQEVADRCNSDIRLVSFAGGLTLPIQAVWSNAAGGCTIGE